MKTITTIATVATDGKITVQLPPDIIAGEHEVVVVINEKPVTREKLSPLKFSAYPVGLVSESLTFRRDELYGCPKIS